MARAVRGGGNVRIIRGNRRVRSARERWSEFRQRLGRWIARHGRKVLVLMVLGSLTGAVVTGVRVLRESDHFRLKQVAIEGVRTASPDEVIHACELRIGEENLLFETAREIEERCEGNPLFRHVDVQIEMPDRLVVRIEEHDVVMYAATPGGLWKVNRYGEAWSPADPGELIAAPLLVGAEAVMADPVRSPEVLRDALSLLRTVTGGPGRSGPTRGPFDGHGLILSWDEVLGFTVQDTATGFRARFGHAPFARKFSRLQRALDVARQRGLTVEMAFLDNEVSPESVTLRLATVPRGTSDDVRGVATHLQEHER